MTDVLTVPTHFGDISELSVGLVDRVDEERIILYGPTAYHEGSQVGFSVLLLDGTPALEGVGRVAAAVDGGEEREPETRFDIVFDTLQLDGRSEVVYERVLLARQSMAGEAPGTGEVDIAEVEQAYADQGYVEEVPQQAPVAQDAGFEDYADQATMIATEGSEDVFSGLEGGGAPAADATAAVDISDIEEMGDLDASFEAQQADAAPQAPSAPPAPPAASAPGGLMRPMLQPSWWPAAMPRPEPRPSTGLFAYPAGQVPIPERPARPPIDASQRVRPAPRPQANGEAHVDQHVERVEQHAEQHEQHVGQAEYADAPVDVPSQSDYEELGDTSFEIESPE